MIYENRKAKAQEVMNELKAKGHESIWGGRKGNGFWIKGKGWTSYSQARKLAKQ